MRRCRRRRRPAAEVVVPPRVRLRTRVRARPTAAAAAPPRPTAAAALPRPTAATALPRPAAAELRTVAGDAPPPPSSAPAPEMRCRPRAPRASLVAAHGGVATCFDAALAARDSVLTLLPAVDSLVAVSPSLAAVGDRDFPGVHLCRFSDDAPAAAPRVLSWPDSPSAIVLSMAATSASGAPQPPPWLFASFESARNSSAVVAFDLNSMSPVAEIGRREVFGADVEAAIPAIKLGWVGGHNLLLAAGSHSGPAGVVGDIRMWDVRASATMPVWEVREKENCFADVAASNTLSALFKVGAASGEVFMADLRKLGGGGIGLEPWVCIGDGQRAAMAASSGRKDGNGCKIECYYSWVFVAHGADVEVWSQVE